MSSPDEAAMLNLTVSSLHQAIRRLAARTLEAPGTLGAGQFRQVERLMRIAIALAGAGRGLPFVEIHGIPPSAGPADPSALPELFSVKLTDLLAARASDHLNGALGGDPEALRAIDKVAEKLLTTENIQLG
jgi:hypothetical protein